MESGNISINFGAEHKEGYYAGSLRGDLTNTFCCIILDKIETKVDEIKARYPYTLEK